LVVVIALFVTVEAVQKTKLKPQGPVPRHYRAPLIDTSATSSLAKRKQLTTIAKIIGTEPSAAKLPPVNKNMIDADAWNGEDVTAEDIADRKAKVIYKEVKSLKALIRQGLAIVKVLPKKQARLKLLQKRLLKLTAHKARAAAAEKLEIQQSLLKAIAKQEKKMADRLRKLKRTQAKLNKSIKKVKKVVKRGKKKGKKRKERKKEG